MSLPLQRWFLAGLLSLCVLWSGMARAADNTAGSAFFDSSLGDFAAEMKTARQQGKLGVLLAFEAEGCPYCHRMREQVLSKPEVQALYRKHFAIYSVDMLGSIPVTDFGGTEVTEKGLARQLKVRATPTYIAFGADGKELARFTGVAKDVAEFIKFGRFVSEGHWQKMTFDQFRSLP